MLYVISYDQHRDKDYTPIWTALGQWGAQRILESVWLMQSNATAGQLRDALRAQTRDEWATFNTQMAGAHWLTTFVRRY
jgi:hypothetical protein